LLTVALLLPSQAAAKRLKPLIWDMEQLEQQKMNYWRNQDAQKVIQDADKYCGIEPISVVTNKRLSLGPNAHYFSSMGPYRWADPKNPGKYIIKDGVMNPDWKYYDSGKLNDMITRCVSFSKAYYFTRDRKYYNAFVNQLRVWFINADTYMEPNFEYSQADPSQENFKSNSTGMIEAYVFVNLTESIYLLNSTKRIDKKTMNAMKEWMHRFADWSYNTHGAYFDRVDNNISLAFDVTLADLYLFAGEEKKARQFIDGFAQKRILKQIKEDGSQPAELIRTRAYYYSLYNLSHIMDFCRLARYWDRAYYAKNGERIDKAFEYLEQYLDDPSTFPYQQITDWEECKNTFKLLSKSKEKIQK